MYWAASDPWGGISVFDEHEEMGVPYLILFVLLGCGRLDAWVLVGKFSPDKRDNKVRWSFLCHGDCHKEKRKCLQHRLRPFFSFALVCSVWLLWVLERDIDYIYRLRNIFILFWVFFSLPLLLWVIIFALIGGCAHKNFDNGICMPASNVGLGRVVGSLYSRPYIWNSYRPSLITNRLRVE